MMRTFTIAFALAALAAPAVASEKEAKEILDRAVKAHGGTAALNKAARCKRTETGTHAIQGRSVPIVSQAVRDLPDRVKLTVEIDKSQTHIIVLDGEKAYVNDGGTTKTLMAQRVKEVREEAYIDWVMTLTPLLKSGTTLSTLAKAKVNGVAAVGIKAARKGQPDVSLYFDEKTNLLLKIEWRGSLAGLGVDKERLYSAHKTFSGVKLASKETALINGKKFTEFTVSDVSFPEKLDDKSFAKP
jgi:hypothetical protein